MKNLSEALQYNEFPHIMVWGLVIYREINPTLKDPSPPLPSPLKLLNGDLGS